MVSSVLGVSNLRRPPYLVLRFTALFVLSRKELSVILMSGVLAVSAQGCALGGYSGSLIFRITCCVRENVKNGFFVLVVFTTK